jgi:hypothetical protein
MAASHTLSGRCGCAHPTDSGLVLQSDAIPDLPPRLDACGASDRTAVSAVQRLLLVSCGTFAPSGPCLSVQLELYDVASPGPVTIEEVELGQSSMPRAVFTLFEYALQGFEATVGFQATGGTLDIGEFSKSDTRLSIQAEFSLTGTAGSLAPATISGTLLYDGPIPFGCE